jgi:hypothetical protein
MKAMRGIGLLWATVSPKIGIDPRCEEYFANPDWKGDELKIVLDPTVYTTMLAKLPARLGDRFKHYYIQPCSEDFGPAINFVKENPQWRLSLQTQKILNVE